MINLIFTFLYKNIYKLIKTIWKKQLTGISLFSGAGGGDTLGMKNASIDVIGYVEFNKQDINTHTHNFPECKKIGEDITKIDNNTFEK